MSTSGTEFLAPSPEAIATYKRAAIAERAAAIASAYRSTVEWLRGGLALRHSDDAFTHPAAGPLCGC